MDSANEMEWGINARFDYRRGSRHIHRDMLIFGSDDTTALVGENNPRI